MHAKDAIRHSLQASQFVIDSYLDGLSDEDLLVRPVEGMNHIAWQLGHLILVERMVVESARPGSCPPLPDGFAEVHAREPAAQSSSDKGRFRSLAEYQALWRAQREATRTVLDSLSDAELDSPGPERIRHRARTMGEAFNMMGVHALTHAGQFVPVRRLRNRPVAF